MRLLTLGSAALLVLVALQIGQTGEGHAKSAEAIDSELVDDAGAILKSVWTTRKKGCGLGSDPATAASTVKRSAGYYFTYVIPLAKSPFATGKRAGIVEFDLTKGDGHVDEVRVSILTGRYDIKALSAKLIEVGRGLGVELEPDTERERCWTGSPADGGVGWLSFSFGEGVVRIEASL